MKTESQKKGILKTLVIVAGIISISLGLFINKILTPASLTKDQLREQGVYLFEKPRSVKDFSLLDKNAKPFTKADLKGSWSLVFFGFTHCPDVCPTTLATLNQFYQQMKKEPANRVLLDSTRIILVSVDPAKDTPQVLKNYVTYFNPNFNALTGEFISIYNFATNLNAPFKKVVQGSDYTVDHSAYIFVLNAHGDFQGFIKPPIDVASLMEKYPAIRHMYR
ncbi:MAG: SCO family protein [Sinobacterium sp.]|nr:SCO family protein [Sinobacterium sp.]